MSALELLLTCVLAVSIVLCSCCFAAEVCYRRVVQSRWLPFHIRQFLGVILHLPTYLWGFCTVVHICAVVQLGTTYHGPQLNMNPDIAGVGVRVGLYIPQGMAALTLILGHWHAEPCGIKELCIVQLVCR